MYLFFIDIFLFLKKFRNPNKLKDAERGWMANTFTAPSSDHSGLIHNQAFHLKLLILGVNPANRCLPRKAGRQEYSQQAVHLAIYRKMTNAPHVFTCFFFFFLLLLL